MAQKKADEMKAVSLQAAIDTVEKLEVKLAEFAQRHRAELSSDPVFRKRFLDMCAPLGIDPLSAKKSFWNNLGFESMGDFYHELAVKVAEICLAHRNTNGGIMSMAELQSLLARRKTRLGSSLPSASSGGGVSPADIQIAVGKLAKLGGGFRTVQVGSSTMVVSVPTELDSDHCQVMTVAIDAGGEGGITPDAVRRALGWSEDRAERALRLLLQQGMAWIDEYRGQSLYWFPSVWQERRNSSSSPTP
jgi:ESCRT-II complex subunit VPS22